jgi:hypothetical protein
MCEEAKAIGRPRLETEVVHIHIHLRLRKGEDDDLPTSGIRVRARPGSL